MGSEKFDLLSVDDDWFEAVMVDVLGNRHVRRILRGDTCELVMKVNGSIHNISDEGIARLVILDDVSKNTVHFAQKPQAASMPDVETLARALFECDDRVKDFVHKVSDSTLLYDKKYWAAMDIAWRRDEMGLRTKFTTMAEDALFQAELRKAGECK